MIKLQATVQDALSLYEKEISKILNKLEQSKHKKKGTKLKRKLDKNLKMMVKVFKIYEKLKG